jgi:hypothetical protein
MDAVLATRAAASGDAVGTGSDGVTAAADRGAGGSDGGGGDAGGGVTLPRPTGVVSGVVDGVADSDDAARIIAGGGQIGSLRGVVTGAMLDRSVAGAVLSVSDVVVRGSLAAATSRRGGSVCGVSAAGAGAIEVATGWIGGDITSAGGLAITSGGALAGGRDAALIGASNSNGLDGRSRMPSTTIAPTTPRTSVTRTRPAALNARGARNGIGRTGGNSR